MIQEYDEVGGLRKNEGGKSWNLLDSHCYWDVPLYSNRSNEHTLIKRLKIYLEQEQDQREKLMRKLY